MSGKCDKPEHAENGQPSLKFGIMLILTTILLVFSVLDPQEEDRRREFMVWKYEEKSFIRVLASDFFRTLGLEGNFSSADIIDAFDKVAEEEERSRCGRSSSKGEMNGKAKPAAAGDAPEKQAAKVKAPSADENDRAKTMSEARSPDQTSKSFGASKDKLKRELDVPGPYDAEDASATGHNTKAIPGKKKKQVIVNISLIPGTGWGHLGYEVLFGLLDEANETAVEPIFVGEVHPDALHPSSPRATTLPRLLESHRSTSTALFRHDDSRMPYPAVHATDHYRFDRPRIIGTPNVALVFFDSFNFTVPLLAAAAASFDAIIVGSEWNAAILRETGLALPIHLIRQAFAPPVEYISQQRNFTLHTHPLSSLLRSLALCPARPTRQGVDTALFHPALSRPPSTSPVSAPTDSRRRPERLAGRFVVFSGGKFELRKAQVRARGARSGRGADALLPHGTAAPRNAAR
jgi:hypothetical protein